jgi:hypothetical protein
VTGRAAREVVWLISGNDFQEHAFHDVDETKGFLEALCEHSVQPDRLVNPNETALTAKRCVACLLIHGDELADQHGDDTDWTRR